MSLKLVKKWMIIPYQEENPEREKIQRILSNKSINNNDKLKFINNIIISKNQLNNDIFGKDQKNSTENKEYDSVPESTDSRVGPGGNSTMFSMRDEKTTPSTFSNEQKNLEEKVSIKNDQKINYSDDNLIDDFSTQANEIDLIQQEPDELKFKDLDKTFKNLYDYLPPAEQTRSKSDIDRSYLTLSKQKKRTKHRPQTPEKLKGRVKSILSKKRKNFTQNNLTSKRQKQEDKVEKSKGKKLSTVNENEVPVFFPNNPPDLEFQKKLFTGFDKQEAKQAKKISSNNTLKIFNQDILAAPLKKPNNFKWTKYNGSTPKKKLF
jgi:hypothetical protein